MTTAEYYDAIIAQARQLMLAKNADYGESPMTRCSAILRGQPKLVLLWHNDVPVGQRGALQHI